MPVDRKPLFRPEVIEAQAATGPREQVVDSAEAKTILVRWAELLASPRAEALTERELLFISSLSALPRIPSMRL